MQIYWHCFRGERGLNGSRDGESDRLDESSLTHLYSPICIDGPRRI